MLDANEAKVKSSNVELEMKVDDEEKDTITPTTESDNAKASTRILKHMSLQVILFPFSWKIWTKKTKPVIAAVKASSECSNRQP